MFKDQFKPDDFHANPSYNTIITDFESNLKIVASMFCIVLENIVLSITFTINPYQGKTCVISQKQPYNRTLLFRQRK